MRKVYIKKTDNGVEAAITVNGILEQFYRLNDGLVTGSVFNGKVINIRKAVGIFIDVGEERNGLLPYREGLKVGDYVLVQAVKEPRAEKGCALTEKLTLAGRYLILNTVGEIKFSHRITEFRKIELFSVAEKAGSVGYIFRTLCEKAENEKIKAESIDLLKRYESIVEASKNNYHIQKLYEDTPIEIAKRLAETDGEIIYGFDEIADSLKNMSQRKVENDGVEIVIDKTEAMTVIDVNNHSFRKQYDTPERSNLEANFLAATEIARQIRLRNISGIIMIDFISLVEKCNKEALLRFLREELKNDNVMVKAELIESLSLIAITRKALY